MASISQKYSPPPLPLTERCEFIRLYISSFTYPLPVEMEMWIDPLLTDWLRETGPESLCRELAFAAITSHPDFPHSPEKQLGCGRVETVSSLAGKSRLTAPPVYTYIDYLTDTIQTETDFALLNSLFRAFGRLYDEIPKGAFSDIRERCAAAYNRWHSIIKTAAAESPEYLELRRSVPALFPPSGEEKAIPPAIRMTPSISYEQYLCFFRGLTRMVTERYESVFGSPLDRSELFTAYLFGYDYRHLCYTMGQAEKYVADPRVIAEKQRQGAIPPWRPFTEEQHPILAARISLSVRWILNRPGPALDQAYELAGRLTKLPASA